MFDKWGTFIARMPSITSNIPSTNFYSSTMSDFVRIARSTNLLDGMPSQGSSKHLLQESIDIQRLFKNILLWL